MVSFILVEGNMKKKETTNKNFSRSQIMTPKEAAGYLGLHPITIYRLVKKGELPGFKVGGQWRFKKDLLDEWIVRKTNAGNK
jgi:excisionase family DNA binding protein